jgi:DNA-binding winged helix-turn-helix (wHTH) protein
MRLAFDGYVLDIARRELRRGAELIAVEPQVFDLLFYLAENPDRVIGRDELLRAVWQGRFVSDSAVTNRITAARRAIGDSGETQRLIRTVPRRGIRFMGRVEEAPAETKIVRAPGKRWAIKSFCAVALLATVVALIIAWPRLQPTFHAEIGAGPRVLVSTLPMPGTGDLSLPVINAGGSGFGREALSRPTARAAPAVAKPNREVAAPALPAPSIIPAAVEQEQKAPLPDIAVAPPAPIQHLNPFYPSDGTYSGALSVKSGRRLCAFLDSNRTVTIQDGRFSLLLNPIDNAVLKGEVDATGKVTASGSSPQGGAALEGVIRDRILTGDITTAYCVFGLRLSRASD